MNKPKLFYFDAPVSRGEECRLALTLAGLEFEDVRVPFAEWPAMRAQTPYGAMPVLELADGRRLAQTNAILVLIGRRHGLHPTDDVEAARHEALMGHVEDLRHKVGPVLRVKDEPARTDGRAALVADVLPAWGAATERQLTGEGPFVAGAKPNVVDLKLHMAVRWFAGGNVDLVPPTIFAGFPRLTRLHEAVRDLEAVRGWYARQ